MQELVYQGWILEEGAVLSSRKGQHQGETGILPPCKLQAADGRLQALER